MGTSITGHGTVALVDTLGGGSPNQVLSQLTMTLTTDSTILDSTTKDGNRWTTNEYGNTSWNATVNMNIDSQAGGDTTGQVLVETAQFNRQKIDFRITEDGTGATYDGTALVASIPRTADQNGIQILNFSLTGDGALVKS